MIKMRTLLAATAIAGFASSALAADIIESVPTPPVAVEVPFTWTGAYIGGQVGFLNADIEIDDVDVATSELADADDFIGGVHAGFNGEFRGFVVGAYADIDFGDVDIDFFGPGGNIDIGDINYIARGMVKVGAGLGRALVYAQGGVAYIDADVEAVVTASGADESIDETGYVVGAGVDYALTDNVIVGADYLYHNFDGLGTDTNVLGAGSDTDVDAHTFRAKFAYKF